MTTRACGATHVPVHQIPRLSKQVAKIDCCILTTIFLCVCTKCANTPCIGESTSHVTKRLTSSFKDFITKYIYFFVLCCVSHFVITGNAALDFLLTVIGQLCFGLCGGIRRIFMILNSADTAVLFWLVEWKPGSSFCVRGPIWNFDLWFSGCNTVTWRWFLCT